LSNNTYENCSPSRLSEFSRYLPKDKSFKFVEYGPASGETLFDILSKFPKANLQGFDINPVKHKNHRIKIDYLNLESNLELQKYKNLINQSDFHLFNDVIEHLSSPYGFLKNFLPLIKVNSLIIISCPNFKSIRFLIAWLTGIFPKEESGFFDKTHLQWFTKKEFENFFLVNSYKMKKSGYIFSKKYLYNFIQHLYPSRFCSQFYIIINKV